MLPDSAFSKVTGGESKHCRKKIVTSGNPLDVVETSSDTNGGNGTASEVKMGLFTSDTYVYCRWCTTSFDEIVSNVCDSKVQSLITEAIEGKRK